MEQRSSQLKSPQENNLKGEVKLFKNPEEELAYLRAQVAKQEELLIERAEKKGETPHIDREELIMNELKNYVKKLPEETLEKGYRMIEPHQQAIVLDLPPESHDENMSELIGMIEEKGIYNTLSIVGRMNNPHIEDDFHRFLVGFVKKGYQVNKLNSNETLSHALHHTLFEVNLPQEKKAEKEKTLKELLSKMEQFYAGMLTISGEKNIGDSISIELAVSDNSQEFIFYISVPDTKASLFEKQILSIFPNAKIYERKEDYNIFNAEGVTAASVATFNNRPIYPLKTYEQFDYDPLNVILNGFSKLQEVGEGASLQIVFNASGTTYSTPFSKALEELQKGKKAKDVTDISFTFGETLKKELKTAGKDFIKDMFAGAKSDKEKEKEASKKAEDKRVDDIAVEQVKHKIASPIVAANIRLVASAQNRSRAEDIITDLEASFSQYQNTTGNSILFKRVKDNEIGSFVRDFSFRMFNDTQTLPLNLKELTSIMHFPEGSIVDTGQLKQSKAGTAPAPLDIPQTGVYLGMNKHRNVEKKIFMSSEDRLRHFYIVGQTGTGKSVFLKNMIIQDIKNGDGVCFIDPHGSDVLDILSHVPPERYDDVIYFDPSQTERPMAMNMLEYDIDQPQQKTFVVNELFSIFDKLFDMKTSGGPMFEQYFRNATMLVLEDPESGCTLLDVSRVLANKTYRELKLSKCKNPIVLQFWREIADKAGGESSLANIVPYITSKFDVFLANDVMRPLVAQEKSSFNFRDVMDNKKILLVNLSKGKLGDINASLIGLILVGKILMAALSRVDLVGTNLNPFYLYIDEFQNVTTNSISVILSEARKYKLSLHIAHQFIAQLKDEIKDAVFGNVGSMISYRVGAEDAEFLEKQFGPTFTAHDIMNLDNLNAYARLLIGGKPARPFNIAVPFPPTVSKDNVEALKQLSFLKYGRNKDEIAEIIAEKYKKEAPKPLPPLDSPLKRALDPFAKI